MADDSLALSVDMRVQHCKEVRGQLAVRTLYGKVLLVIAHHRNQNLFGQRQILGIEVAQHNSWPLGEMDDGLDQRGIFAPARAGDGAGHGV